MIFKYKQVCRCKKCGKIYSNGTPEICEKCGTKLGFIGLLTAPGKITLTDNCEKVIARKRGLIKWEVKNDDE